MKRKRVITVIRRPEEIALIVLSPGGRGDL